MKWNLPWMTGTRIEVRTRNDMDRMSGDESDKSRWKVLMDRSNRSEFVEALLMSSYYLGAPNNSQAQQVDVD